MPDDLNDVVSRIAIAVAAHDDPRAAIKRELRAVQAATWREAAEWVRGVIVGNAPLRQHVWIADSLDDRAAALHPKESNDE